MASITTPAPLEPHNEFPGEEVPIQLSKRKKLRAGRFIPVKVTCAHSGFVTIRPYWRAQHKAQILAANGVAEIKHEVVFKIRVGNFGDHDVTLPKQFRKALADKTPPFVAETTEGNRNDETTTTEKGPTPVPANPGKAPFTRATKRR